MNTRNLRENWFSPQRKNKSNVKNGDMKKRLSLEALEERRLLSATRPLDVDATENVSAQYAVPYQVGTEELVDLASFSVSDAVWTKSEKATEFAAPTNVKANAEPKGLTVTWDAVDGAKSYLLEYRIAGTGDNSPFTKTIEIENGEKQTTTAPLGWSAVNYGTAYEFRVQAVVNGGESEFSDWVVETTWERFDAPTNVDAVATKDGLTITWDAAENATAETKYAVEYRVAGKSEWEKLEVSETTATLGWGDENKINGLKYETTYEIRVKTSEAIKTANGDYIDADCRAESEYADSVVKKTWSKRAAELQVETTANAQGLTVVWNAAEGATYEVKCRVDGSTEDNYQTAKISGSTATFGWVDENNNKVLKYGTTYEIQIVETLDGAANVATLEATTWERLTAPGNVVAVANAQGLTISWNAVAGAGGYALEYRVAGSDDDAWTRVATSETTATLGWDKLACNQEYEIRVKATPIAAGYVESEYSASAFPKTWSEFAKRIGGETIANAQGLTVVWNAAEGATYEVKCRVDGSTEDNYQTAKISGSTATFGWGDENKNDENKNNGLQYGTTYEIQIVETLNGAATVATLKATTWEQIGSPTGAKATPVKEGVAITWNPVRRATAYAVEYRVAGTNAWETVEVTAARVVLGWNKLTYETTYEIRVKTLGIDGYCESKYVNFDSATTWSAFAASINASVTANAKGLTVKWDKVQDASGYVVEYRVAGTTAWKTVATSETTAKLDWNALAHGENYEVRVKTTPNDRYSATLNATTWKKFNAPGNVKSSATAEGLEIKWDAVDNATAYEVAYRSETSDAWKTFRVADTTTATVAWEDGLSGNATYEVKVKALAVGGVCESDWCKGVEVQTLNRLASPSVRCKALATSIELHWDDVDGADEYVVEYKIVNNPNALNIWSDPSSFSVKECKASACILTDLAPDEYYAVRVKARDVNEGDNKGEFGDSEYREECVLMKSVNDVLAPYGVTSGRTKDDELSLSYVVGTKKGEPEESKYTVSALWLTLGNSTDFLNPSLTEKEYTGNKYYRIDLPDYSGKRENSFISFEDLEDGLGLTRGQFIGQDGDVVFYLAAEVTYNGRTAYSDWTRVLYDPDNTVDNSNSDADYEENDTFETAADLGVINSALELNKLQIVGEDNDCDYYKFQVPKTNQGAQTRSYTITMTYEHNYEKRVDLDMQLWECDSESNVYTVCGSSGKTSGSEVIEVNLKVGETYYIYVYNFWTSKETTPYDLTITPAQTGSSEIKLNAPANLAVVGETGYTSVKLSWSDWNNSVGADEEGYLVEYRVSGTDSWTLFKDDVEANTMSVVVDNLAPGETYDFRVTAIGNKEKNIVNSDATPLYDVKTKASETYSTVVTTDKDTTDPYDNLVSLREAIYYAERGATITFASDVTEITLESALKITADVAIDGQIDGQNNVEIKANKGVSVSASARLELANLTLVGGTGVTNGGAIYNVGTTSATNVKFVVAGTGVTNGGAVYNEGTFSATLCKFDGGTGVTNGGAIYQDQKGGSASCYVANSEFVRNNALNGGAIYLNGGSLDLYGSTIAGNTAQSGGGIYVAGGTASLYNTIVALNKATNDGDDVYATSKGEVYAYNALSSFNGWTQSSNVCDKTSPLFVAAPIFENGALTNGADINLQLSEKSVAIDAGDDARVATSVDLAGNRRVQGASVDLGAYESSGEAPNLSGSIVVTTADDTVADDGKTSLREAIQNAKDGDVITFDPNVFSDSRTFNLSDSLVIAAYVEGSASDSRVARLAEGVKNITIDGRVGLDTITLDANGLFGAIEIADGDLTITFKNLTVADGNSLTPGGAVRATSAGVDLTFENVVFQNNKSTAANIGGGAIYMKTSGNKQSKLTIVDSSFDFNRSYGDGGAVYVVGDGEDVDVSIKGTTFDGNYTYGLNRNGGALYLGADVKATIERSSFSDNYANNMGGAIFNYANLTIDNTAIYRNSAYFGAAVYNDSKSFKATNASIAYNDGGGALFCTAGSTTELYNTIVARNYTINPSNSPDIVVHDENAVVKGYNVLTNFGGWAGSENTKSYSWDDAIFVSEYDLRLVATATKAIDQGNNKHIDLTSTDLTDLSGGRRVNGDVVDLGAYEFGDLETPSGLAAVATADGITLSWNVVSDTARYEISYRGGGVVEVVEGTGAVVEGTVATFNFGWDVLEDGEAYEFKIMAYDGSVSSGYSDLVRATTWKKFAAPTDLVATPTADGLTLTWKPVENAETYTIAYGDGKTLVVSATEATLGWDLLTPDTTYEITVTVDQIDDEYVASEPTQTVATTWKKFAAPTDLVATPTADGLTLTWTPVENAETYTIAYGDGETRVVSTAEATFGWDDLEFATEYQFSVTVDWKGGYAASDATDPVVATTWTKLAAPNVSNVVVGKGGVVVRWAKVANAFGYEIVYAAADSDEIQSEIVEAGKTQALLKMQNLRPSSEYTITVKALGGDGYVASEFSAEVAAETLPQLVAPTDVAAEATEQGVAVTWSAAENATAYAVGYRLAGSDDEFVTIAVQGTDEAAPATELTFGWGRLEYGTAYEFCVRASCETGFVDSAFSASAEATTWAKLKTPTITSTEVGAKGVLVRWAKVANAASYEIRYSVVGSDETQTLVVASNKSAGLLEGVDFSTTFSISVRATAAPGRIASDYSPSVKVKTPKQIATPQITETEIASNVLVKWNKVYGAASYTVTCVPVDATDVKTVSATTADAEKSQMLLNILRPETKYTITVRANVESGSDMVASQESTPIEITTNAMAAPKLVGTPSAGQNGIALKWKAVNGATGYEIGYRPAGSTDDFTVVLVDASKVAGIAPVTEQATAYEARVKAIGLEGAYGDSEYTTVVVNAKVLATPKQASAVARADGSIFVKWQKVYAAASYAIEYKRAGDDEFETLEVSNLAGSATLRDLDPGTKYAIRVKAVGQGACVDSQYSTELTAKTAGEPETELLIASYASALDSIFADSADEDDEFWTF